jgi:predicted DNA-binding transcriptional regulator AlpA
LLSALVNVNAPQHKSEIFMRDNFETYASGISPPNLNPNLEGGCSYQTLHKPYIRVGKIRDVAFLTKLAPSTIRAKVRTGHFPAPTKLSYKIAIWNLDTVDNWLRSKLNAVEVVNG